MELEGYMKHLAIPDIWNTVGDAGELMVTLSESKQKLKNREQFKLIN